MSAHGQKIVIRNALSSIDADLMTVYMELGNIGDAGYLEDIRIEAQLIEQASAKLLDYVSAAVS